jgi:subtilase family serine protease
LSSRSKSALGCSARLFLEALESRSLLSAVASNGTNETVTPAITSVEPARWPGGGWWLGGGNNGGITNPTPAATALTPANISQSYNLSQSATSGAGTTIAIVDAYNDPNIQSDLATFDAQYNLPSASLTVENQSGQTTNLPRTDPSWSQEIALDVEWVHAAAPGAKILLVEANSANTSDLMQAVQTAANSASVVSMSWGGSEFKGQTAYDTPAYFARPNVTFVAATGDDGGASGAEFPASSPYVLSVGGTTLSLNSAGGYGNETAWSASGSWWRGYSGSGGGVSSVEPLPSYQAAALGTSYASGRVTPDVSADANPATGLSVYDSVPGTGQTGWFQVGGTSAGTPVWAGIVAAADSARAANHLAPLSSTQTLSLLYSLYGTSAKPATSYASAFHDISTGANFAGTAGKGYDMVTGLGSPIASSIITAAASSGSKSAAILPAVTTVSTPVTPARAQVVIATAPTVSTPATVALSATVVPLVPSVPAAQTASATPSASILTATSVNQTPARPAQPISTATPDSIVSSSDAETVVWPVPPTQAEPAHFLPPADTQEIRMDTPLFASGSFGRVWDAALERLVADTSYMVSTGFDLPALPIGEAEPDRVATSLQSIAVAAVAVAVWRALERRARQFDASQTGQGPEVAGVYA